MNTSIVCIDCGLVREGNGTPKDVAKHLKWVHVTKGKWRCTDCQAFQKSLSEQFGAQAENIVIPRRKV